MVKVVLKGYVLVPESELKSVLAELPLHIKLTLQESGCLMFEVKQDERIRGRLNVCEEFESMEAFQHHQDRVKKSKWGRITANVERFYDIQYVDEML